MYFYSCDNRLCTFKSINIITAVLNNPYHYIKDTFFFKTRIYVISEPKEEVLLRLKNLFTKEYGYFLDEGTSSLTTESFKFSPRGILPSSPLFIESNNCYMNGTILEDVPGKTKIITRTRPNIYYFLIFLVSIIGGLFFCINSIQQDNVGGLLTGLCFILFGVPFSIWLTKVFAITFVEKFEKFMKIQVEPMQT